MNVITVKIIRTPGAVVEVGLEAGSTVAQALEAANMTVGVGESISVNGNTVTTSHVLTEGDRLILAKNAKSATD